MKDKFAISATLFFASAVPMFGQQYSTGLATTTYERNQYTSNDCCDDPCCGCCSAKDPCAKCAQLWPSCGPDWIITPGAGPCTANGCDFFITAEFLYWAVRQDHMGFVFSSPTDNTVTTVGEY
nr:hypothetical protein [Chlamydiota bacterium]